MKLILKPETNMTSWLWRSLLGPSVIVDGIVATITLSTHSPNLKTKVVSKLAKSRYNHIKSLKGISK